MRGEGDVKGGETNGIRRATITGNAMQLTIRIKRTYHKEEIKQQPQQSQPNRLSLDASSSKFDSDAEKFVTMNLNCRYKLYYGNEERGKSRAKLGEIMPRDKTLEKIYFNTSAASSSQNPRNASKQIKNAVAIEDHIFMSSIRIESAVAGHLSRKIVYGFTDGRSINFGDFLEIHCYKADNKLINRKPFGKYKMLLDRLISSQEVLIPSSKLEIDDFLVDPKANANLKERISFELIYETGMSEKQNSMDKFYMYKSEPNRFPSTFSSRMSTSAHLSMSYQCTPINFIQTIFETGHFALFNFKMKEDTKSSSISIVMNTNANDETHIDSIKSFLTSKVSYSAVTFNLAFNLLISYELEKDFKESLKRRLMSDNLYADNLRPTITSPSTTASSILSRRRSHPRSDLNKSGGESLSHHGGAAAGGEEELNVVAHLHALMQQMLYTNEEKITAWQVRVRIVELKHLVVGAPIGQLVYCLVEIDGNRFRTRPKQIDALNFEEDDEVFIARIETKDYQKALNYQIVISVYFKNLFYDTLVGKFVTDFGTIYRQPGHEVYHKWGEILAKNDNPETADMNSSTMFPSEYVLKGYVKFDIILQSKGDKAKIHYFENQINDLDEIENDIFHPYGLNSPREFIKITIMINKAHILEKSQKSMIERFKSSIFNSTNWFSAQTDETVNKNEQCTICPDESILSDIEAQPDPSHTTATNKTFNDYVYVRVTYSGHTKQTKLVHKTDRPKWNSKIEFNIRYPPLVWVMKLELCSGNGTPDDIVLATEYINLNELSNFKADDDTFYPTFGPRYIDLYSKPNNLRVKRANLDNDSDSDTDSRIYYPLTADGSFYVARMLFSVSSQVLQTISMKRLAKVTSQAAIPTMDASSLTSTEYVAYVMINEATMIDLRHKYDLLSFKLTVGIHGHETIEGARRLNNQTEPSRPIQLNASMPLYLPYEKVKPCVCLKFSIEDNSKTMFMINFIDSNLKDLMTYYSKLKEYLWEKKTWTHSTHDKAQKIFKDIHQLTVRVKSYLEEYVSIATGGQTLTELERIRATQLKRKFALVHDSLCLLLQLVDKFKNSASNKSFMTYIDLVILHAFTRIRIILRQPLSHFPDLSLWLMASKGSSGEEPVGVLHLKASDVIWSADKKKCGPISCRMIYTDVKSLRENDFNATERENLARVRIYAWLRRADEISISSESPPKNLYDLLPDNFGEPSMKAEHGLPSKLIQIDRHTFQLHAYLYQGRDMLLLDIAGESDPFARITLHNQTVQSKTIDNTVNPTWNEFLCIPEIYFYGRLENIFLDPPEVIVDIYDEDPFNIEFMGRVYVKPEVRVNTNDTSSPPKLKWLKLNHTYQHAGDILASFELVYIGSGKLPEYMTVMPTLKQIPDTIKPKTRPYTLEIYYWGLRNLKEHSGFIAVGQQKISVKIEIGNQSLEPNIMEKCITNGNFLITHRKYRIELPEEDEYKPHLNIRCECFGTLFLYSSISLEKYLDAMENTVSRKMLFGTCTIKSIGNYCFNNDQLDTFRKRHVNRNLVHSISINEDGSPSLPKSARNRMSMRKTRGKTELEEDGETAATKEVTAASAAANESGEGEELDLSYLDWWSKYFHSMMLSAASASGSSGLSTGQQRKNKTVASAFIKGITEENENDPPASDIDIEDKSDVQSQSDTSSKKRKKKNRKNSALITKHIKKSKLSKTTNKVLKKKNKAFENIPKIQILDRELEKAYDLNETIDAFNLIVGKNKPPTTKDDKLQCRFKGKFMLYDEEKLSLELSNYLNINGGFLKKTPSNAPIKIKCHVYIIKVSIINPIHLIGKFDPYICIECGDEIELTEKIKTDSIEPLIGKCFEFEARFPSESQLTISIKNWNLLGAGGTELIGRTTVDLEDRFYALSYATCGLPKRFDIDGFNRWRDSILPHQLLAKMCRKFGLKMYEYRRSGGSKSRPTLTMYTRDPEQTFTLPFPSNNKKSNLMGLNGSIIDTDSHSSKDSDSDEDDGDSEYVIEESDEEEPVVATGADAINLADASTSLLDNKKRRIRIGPRIDRRLEQLALDALNKWELFTKVPLVQEHIETRSLYNPEAGLDLEQGKIQMWVDMFLLEDYHHHSGNNPVSHDHQYLSPTPVDVSPRKPKKLQLRVVIFNTKEVILDDVNIVTGERKSDIYVKGFLGVENQVQKTDVHYRSLDGEGNFNWRFIFDFEYVPQEGRMVISSSGSQLSAKHIILSTNPTPDRKIRPVLNLLCYDEDQFSRDDLLGQLKLDLGKLKKGASTADKCTLKMVNNREWPTVDLFKVRQIRGWWPFTSREHPGLTGKVELELKLMSEKEAISRPAGLGRSAPDPLPEPNRPETSFLWLTQPLKAFRFTIWKKYWKRIIFFFFTFLIVIGIVLFFVQLPNLIINRLIG